MIKGKKQYMAVYPKMDRREWKNICNLCAFKRLKCGFPCENTNKTKSSIQPISTLLYPFFVEVKK